MKWLWQLTSEIIESVIKYKQSRVDTDEDKKGGMKWLWQLTSEITESLIKYKQSGVDTSEDKKGGDEMAMAINVRDNRKCNQV